MPITNTGAHHLNAIAVHKLHENPIFLRGANYSLDEELL